MKAIIFVAALLILLIGCTPQQSDQLTQQQKDQIKGEAKAVMDSILARWLRLDAEGAVQCYSPDMVAVGDSSIIDFQTYKKGWIDFNNSLASVKWTPIQWEFIVLSKDLAMSAGLGKVEMLMKSGDKMTTNPQVWTDVYRKFGNEWKIIYEHGSGTPVIQKAGKK
jgi:ketosteroid isomerase-like protein